eukprot:3263343-Rhodomonas_salina.2
MTSRIEPLLESFSSRAWSSVRKGSCGTETGTEAEKRGKRHEGGRNRESDRQRDRHSVSLKDTGSKRERALVHRRQVHRVPDPTATLRNQIKKPHSQYNLYPQCGFLYLISHCTRNPSSDTTISQRFAC